VWEVDEEEEWAPEDPSLALQVDISASPAAALYDITDHVGAYVYLHPPIHRATPPS